MTGQEDAAYVSGSVAQCEGTRAIRLNDDNGNAPRLYRYIAVPAYPNHRVIAIFRKLHEAPLAARESTRTRGQHLAYACPRGM